MKLNQIAPDGLRGRTSPLTGKELQVLGLLSMGLKRKEISKSLNVSVHSVNAHLESAYKKLNVHNRAAAVAKVVRENLLDGRH